MKENNNVSKWFVGLSVLLVVIGIVMVVWPNLTIDLLGVITGVCMLVVGLVYVIMYFTKDHMGTVMEMELTVGAVLSAFGAFMLMHKAFVSMALPFAAGIVLLIGGIVKIQHALDMKHLNFGKWQIMLGLAIIMIVLSFVLLYNPFSERALIYVMGASSIVNGAASIVAILLISHRLKKMARGAVYTGRQDHLLADQQAGHRQDTAVATPYGQTPVETVDDPVTVPSKGKKKKGGLFKRKNKKETPSDETADAGTTAPEPYGPQDDETVGNEGFTVGFSGDYMDGIQEGTLDDSVSGDSNIFTQPAGEMDAEEDVEEGETTQTLPQDETDQQEDVHDPFVLG